MSAAQKGQSGEKERRNVEENMEENEELNEQETRTGIRWLWFVGGCALSFTTLCSVVLLLLLLVSTSVNAYLAWILSGYQVSVYQPGPPSTAAAVTAPTTVLVVVPDRTPTLPPPSPTVTATHTPALHPTDSTLEAQVATLAAVVTQAAELEASTTPAVTPEVIAPETPQAVGTPTAAEAGSEASAGSEGSAELATASSSTNTYDLIPIDGNRESRPPEEHGDLNLKLREPQPADVEATLIDIPGSGIDPDAPKLSAVFEPDFVETYFVHDWDWGSNSKGSLMDDGSAVVVGIKTTPGQPIFIPKTDRDIYDGKYVAVVLYASEDSLTYVYARAGNVANGYTVHYEGIQTDPNLLALFQESEGSELPGLTLDTPVGVAAGDEIIVAMRDNGMFLDARSQRDWWE
jgi:hypothetical protein